MKGERRNGNNYPSGEHKKTYRSRSKESEWNEKMVLNGVNLSIHPGEFISIMGRSGSGKSTLLNLLGLLIPPSEGNLFFEGKNITELWKDELADIRRRRIGFIFQDFELIESITAMNNILVAGFLDKKSYEEIHTRALELATELDLSKDLLRKYPYELSGGEKQRVAIIRALINNPDLILADEPTGNLDGESEALVASLLNKVNKDLKKSIVLVTHNPRLAAHSQVFYHLTDKGVLDEPLQNEGSQELFYNKILSRM